MKLKRLLYILFVFFCFNFTDAYARRNVQVVDDDGANGYVCLFPNSNYLLSSNVEKITGEIAYIQLYNNAVPKKIGADDDPRNYPTFGGIHYKWGNASDDVKRQYITSEYNNGYKVRYVSQECKLGKITYSGTFQYRTKYNNEWHKWEDISVPSKANTNVHKVKEGDKEGWKLEWYGERAGTFSGANVVNPVCTAPTAATYLKATYQCGSCDNKTREFALKVKDANVIVKLNGTTQLTVTQKTSDDGPFSKNDYIVKTTISPGDYITIENGYTSTLSDYKNIAYTDYPVSNCYCGNPSNGFLITYQNYSNCINRYGQNNPLGSSEYGLGTSIGPICSEGNPTCSQPKNNGVGVSGPSAPNNCNRGYLYTVTKTGEKCILIKGANSIGESYKYQSCSDYNYDYNNSDRVKKIKAAISCMSTNATNSGVDGYNCSTDRDGNPNSIVTQEPDEDSTSLNTVFTFNLGSNLSDIGKNIVIKACYYNNTNGIEATGGHCNLENGVPKYFDKQVSLQNGSATISIPNNSVYYIHIDAKDDNNPCADENTERYISGYQFYGTTTNLTANEYYNSNKCIDIRKWNDEDGPLKNKFRELVPECFHYGIDPDEFEIFKNNIDSIYENMKTLYQLVNNIYQNDTNINPKTCDFKGHEKGGKDADGYYYIAQYTSLDPPINEVEYWTSMCTEKLYINYDYPKYVKAGRGFDYQSMIKIEKECKPIQLKKVTLKAKCKYTAQCFDQQHKGTPYAGPNEDFDSCINECDNGKYTQKCINKCYDDVYKSSNKVSTILDQYTNYSDNNKITKIANSSTVTSPYINNGVCTKSDFKKNKCKTTTGGKLSWGCVVTANGNVSETNIYNNGTYSNGWECSGINNAPTDYIKTKHGILIPYLADCSKIGTHCFEVYRSTTNCSEKPEELYISELEKADSEYQTAIRNMNTVENGTFYMKIDEDYGINANTHIQTVYDEGGVNNKISRNPNGSTSNNNNSCSDNDKTTIPLYTSTQLIESGKINSRYLSSINIYDSEKCLNTKKTVTSYTLNVGSAFIKSTGNYTANDNISNYNISKTSKNIIYNKSLTEPVVDNNRKTDYGPFNIYFTAMNTKLNVNSVNLWPDFNDEAECNNTESTQCVSDTDSSIYTKNITVGTNGLGTWGQWTGDLIKCFYGTDGEKPAIGGDTIIFRPIDLNNIFPGNGNSGADQSGREPRYNWTGTVENNTTTGAALKSYDDDSFHWDESYYRSENVDPEKLIKSINENLGGLGETIYNGMSCVNPGSYEYRIKLTPTDIRKIRNYTIGDTNGDGKSNTYIDYNMRCNNKYKKRPICTSDFLDSYTKSNSRSALAECNNGLPTSGSILDSSTSLVGSACDTLPLSR